MSGHWWATALLAAGAASALRAVYQITRQELHLRRRRRSRDTHTAGYPDINPATLDADTPPQPHPPSAGTDS